MTYQEENDKLLANILDVAFFDNWKTQLSEIEFSDKKGLQVNITYQCNQKCEYCYLIKYGSELYPLELDKQELIIKNLKILLNWISENYPNLHKMELFSGEIWHNNFGLEVLDVILSHKGNTQLRTIMVPSNMSFILDDEQTQKIQSRIFEYAEQGINLQFSASVDGLYIENLVRPRNDGRNDLRDEKFYEKLFEFLKLNHYSVHPMLSAYAIEHWKGNYVWWYQQCVKYGFSFLEFIMLLEVRNNDWTEEKIVAYEDFLEFQFNFIFTEIFHKDKNLMARYVFGMIDGDCAYQGILWGKNNDQMSCTISNFLAIRLGDLAITPCHRTSYQQFLYGKFVVEDDKIVGIKSNNIQLPVHLLCNNMKNSVFACDACDLRNLCLRQCLGSCYENHNDILIPIESICVFFHRKFYKFLSLIETSGILEEFINDPTISLIEKRNILDEMQNIKEKQYE